MNVRDLFCNNPDYLEKLSDAEVMARLSPYFTVTRPDETKRKAATTPKAAGKIGADKKSKISQLEEKMKLLGL